MHFQCRRCREKGLIPESGRSTEEGNGNPIQYSCLRNPVDRGAWQAMVHRVAKCWTWLNNNRMMFARLLALHHGGLCVFSVAQCCLILCESQWKPWTACSPPGSSVHGIIPARILDWVAISSFKWSFQPRDPTYVSCGFCIGRRILLSLSHLGNPSWGVKKCLVSGGHCIISTEVSPGVNFPLTKTVTI